MSHLSVHHNQQTGLYQQSKGLIVSDIPAVVSDRVPHGGPWDEEEDEGAVAALQHTAHKDFLAEEQVQLAWSVKLRIPETPAVIYILQKQTQKKLNFEVSQLFQSQMGVLWVVTILPCF